MTTPPPASVPAEAVDSKRPREEDVSGPEAKRLREEPTRTFTRLPTDVPPAVSRLGLKPQPPVLPPSLELATGKKTDLSATGGFIGEAEVGIIGYLGDSAFSGVKGVIKQRYTDFLVNEISMAGDILYLKNIARPVDEEETEKKEETAKNEDNQVGDGEATTQAASDLPAELQFEERADWTTSTTLALRSHLSDETIVALHALLLEGKFPKPDPAAQPPTEVDAEESAANQAPPKFEVVPSRQGRQRGRGRGGHANAGRQYVDNREVVSQVIESKEARGAAHNAVREALKGSFESSARETEQGQCIAIKWASGRPAQGQRKQRNRRTPYIHFTLHKTSRETQDCLSHISRMLRCHVKDLTVCGTKDKRAVTVQRVCLKRGHQTTQSVWDGVNGIKAGRRTAEAAVQERGERGTRIGDIEYAQQHLALGMLKGNHFTIVLRNVTADSVEAVDAAMESIRDRGFINFFGMQRFGTSTVPTHVTGLFLLQQKWGEAVDSILSLREGEHPDCVRARLAWLEDKDVNKALEIMPRRSVAERAIWEHWKKGNRKEDKLGALGCIPRNLRTIYVHAYQSYIWNLVASKRIELSRSPMVGDLVFVDGGDDDNDERQAESSSAREVKELTESDLEKYTMADVILPLPGWNVEYPSGPIRKLYEDILAADGMDPARMRRDQREYSLPGSYRKLIHTPKNVSWEHIRYTDPDINLSQCDEDRILGLNIPAKDDPEGKFRALKVSWTLGTSCYATMALREITRQETATWNQINLTLENEDQAHKGSSTAA